MTLLRLKYLKVYRDRHGTVRRYFRRRGQKDLPLKGDPGTAEFMQAYQAAFGTRAPAVDEAKAGTFGRLIADYRRSAGFANLKPSSQKLYKLVLDRIAERHGHRLVRDARRSDARKMVEEIGAAKPAMANITRAVLRLLMQYAVDAELRLDNPVTGLKAYRTGTRHTWTDDELSQFERSWPLGTRERLAFALLLFTGQRAGDVVKMRRSELSDGLIRVIQEKTGAELSIPLHPALIAAIKAAPAKGVTLIGDANGRPIKRATLTLIMRKAVESAGLPTRCVAHGLRKAIMRRLAESGSSTKEIAAISGHRTLKEIERYTAAADQVRLSKGAMAKLTGTKRRT
jgi:enterobacteria phage integrase